MFRRSVFNKRKFLVIKRRRRGNAESTSNEDDARFQFHEEESKNPNEISSFDAEEIFPEPVEEGSMPSFFHIGLNSKNCLIKGYKIGVWHIDCASQANDNISLYSYGQARPTVDKIAGGVALRETFGSLEMTQVWQTEGLMGTIGVATSLLGGKLYTLLRGTYAHGGNDSGESVDSQNENSNTHVEVHAGYDNTSFRTEVIVPVLKSSKLLGYVLVRPVEKLLLGYRSVFDVDNKEFDKHVLCAGFDDGSNELGLKLENFTNLRGSIFRQLTDKWAVALKGNIIGEDERRFAVGGQYQFAERVLLKGKIRDDGIMGFVWQQKAKEKEIDIMYHISFDLRSPLRGDHKIGVSYSFRG